MNRVSLLLAGLLVLPVFSTAQILQGTTTVSSANNMTITVTVNTNTNTVDLTMSGNSTKYFAYGFGGSMMNGTYAIITDGSGNISERNLGNQQGGTLLTSSLTSSSTSTSGTVRTTTVTRPRTGSNANYFTFPNQAGNISLIWAKGSSGTFGGHSTRGFSSVSLTDICNIPVTTLPSAEICQGDSIQVFGTYQSAAGIYYDTLTTAIGCDSVLSQEITIGAHNPQALESQPVTVGALYSSISGDAYQWVYCPTDSLIPNATDSTFQVPQGLYGPYRVDVTIGNCTYSSNCITSSVGIEELGASSFTLYPNPATEQITLRWKESAIAQIEIRNSNGQLLYTTVLSNASSHEVELNDYPAGQYTVRIITEATDHTLPLIIQ